MGKTTICDGEILFTSKKDTLIHAFDGHLEFDAVGKNQWKGSETEIGDYVPTAIGEENENFIACIDFYRSLDNSNGAFGSADKVYTGQFGFDRFDKKVCGEGLASRYTKLSSVVPSADTYSNKKEYLCAYLSIWSPGILENPNNEKSKITLYTKAFFASTVGTKKTAQVEFISSEPSKITVSASAELTIDGEAKPITIECKESFDKDIEIIAKAKDEPQILGKLIIKANATIYTTTIQAVEVVYNDTAKGSTIEDIPHDDCIKELEKYFNEKSFNQAYIYMGN